MKEILEINEFFVEGNDQKKSHVLLHITEPGTPEELSKGYFFALAEINDGNLEQIEHLQQMIDDLESGYYETDDEPNKNAFEITLEYINRRGHHILENTESTISCLLGVIRKNDVYFAYHGKPGASIFYQENGELQAMDILGEQTSEEKNNQMFSSIIQGNINEGDYLFINTPHVSDYFSADRIKKLLNIKNNHQVATHLEKTLKDVNDDYSFGGIFIHIPSYLKTAHSTSHQESTGSVASLDQMIGRERNTDEIMSPPILGALKKNLNNYKDKKKEEEQAKELLHIQEKRKQEVLKSTKHGSIETNIRHNDQMIKQPGLDGILVNLGKALVTGTLWILNFIKLLLITLGRILIGVFLFITNKDKRRQEVIKSVKNNFKNQKEKISSLSLFSKIIFFLTIVLAIIFISSLSYFKMKEVKESRETTYNNQIQAIKDKQASADSNLLYNNTDSALVLLTEAKNLLNNLETNSKDQETEKTNLQNQLETSLQKIRKLETKTPELLVDLSSSSVVQTQKLAFINNDIIAYSQEDPNIYILNPSTRQVETKNLSTAKNFKFDSTPKESDYIAFITNNNELATFDAVSKLTNKKDISYPVNNVQYGPIFIYNRRLYGIDRQSGQIYKHSSTQTGFDQGTAWLKETTDLSDAVSMTIDGDMFVLKSNGNIYKFTSGEKMDFTITGLDPVLNNPTEIWTYNDTDKIYILESTNKRIIILNKEGKLIQQYTATEWQNPTDMIVRESEKAIYILDSNKIYRFYY